MPSLIPGFKYDIFISYRQKDNKGDMWVSRFVEALKTELEATFKEDVSVYFDENPHDRLQETHNVDKSLEGKLKCLIFIPILSQTYCDPGSYAWQNELLAFIRISDGDHFGEDVKLRNGNVASRILPIRIHDLEPEDLKLFEKETGGVLRAMDFVFKTASGVNRPLKPNEEHPKDNLNKIFYNDQINKVAHSIKDIIQGMKTVPSTLIKEKTEQQKPLEEVIKEETEEKEKSSKLFNPVILSILAIVVLLLIIVLIIYPGIFRKKGIEKSTPGLEKSIAVLPFINDSQDTSNVYFINGLMGGIINKLSNIKDLRVLSRTSVEQYRNNKTKTISQIASELGVSYIVEGSGQKYGDRVILSIQLREADSDKQLFSESYDRNLEDIFNIQGEIATSVAASIKAAITPEETELIGKKYTRNMEALNMYLKGNDLYEMALTYSNTDLYEKVYDRAVPFYKKAIQLDSTYPDPYVRLGWYIYDRGSRNHDSVLYFANRALHFDNKNAKAYALKAAACGFLGLEKDSEEAARLCLQYSPNDGYGYRHMAGLYFRREEYAKTVEYILKAVKFEKDPFWRYKNAKDFIGWILYPMGFYDEGLKYAKEVIKYNNDSLHYYNGLLGVSMNQRDYHSALKTALRLYGWDNTMTADKLLLHYIYAKDYTGALKLADEYVKVQEDQGKKIDPSFYSGYVYLKNGQKEKSVFHIQESIKNQLLKIKMSQPGPKGSDCFYLAGMYSAIDEKGKALESLNEALKYKDSEDMSWETMMDIRKNVFFPPLDLIRDEPEFKEYIKSIEDKVQPELQKIEKLLKQEAIDN